MTDYDDEDYDISNGVLNDYLNEINCDLEQEPRFEAVKIKAETEQFKTDHVPPTRFNNILSYIFFDSNHLTQYFNSTASRSVIDSDKKSLIEIFLFISNSLTNSIDIIEVKNQLSLNKIPLFIILFSCFIFNAHFSIFFMLPCLYFGIFIALFKSYLSLTDLIVSKTADLALDCLQTSNAIIYYLKEVQLVSMASKRRLLIENKINLDETEIDLINYPFRKLVFKHFRKQFYELKHLNMQQLGLIRPELLHIDKLTFICSINNKELSEVLQSHNDYDLNQLSDYFSLSCLKSISKLIQFLISENFKLNQISKLYLIVSMNSLLETAIKSTRNLLILVTVRNNLIKYNSELKDLFNICQMIKQSDSDIEQRFKQVKSKNELEHILLNYIRNALLNCYHLKNIPDEQLVEKKQIAKKLKYDFEYCDLYFKKIENKLEPKNTELKTEQPIVVSNTTDHLNITDNNLPIDLVVYEDEIYEADIIDNAHSNRMESSEDFEILLKESDQDQHLVWIAKKVI